MQIKMNIILGIFCLSTLMSCSQNENTTKTKIEVIPKEKVITKKQESHRYGGWYCPDNLNGFPAVDIKDWESVPVVNGRMATKEETQNGTSLIFVDVDKYPNAKPLDMKMPRLAQFYNHSSGKEEIIIVIQALNISNDSVVGFRYLNGGNGSANLNEVKFLSEQQIANISSSHFVTIQLEIDATKNEVWNVMTKPEYSKTLQAIFDKENTLPENWNEASKVNFKYLKQGEITAQYAGELFGNQYIQIDSQMDDQQLVEKFFLTENEQGNKSNLHIVCGPYGADFTTQQEILQTWAQEVKELSERL